ncbi:MAG: sigma-70 family RNA polymerase sigma factor [Polyangiaceae bacterium]
MVEKKVNRVAQVALFLQTKSNDYQELLREDCLNATRRHEMGVRVFTADNNAKRQASQIREILAEDGERLPSVILVSPVQEDALAGLAREAAKKGVGWVVLNRWSASLPELRTEFPKLPIFSVTPDQYEIGHVQGRQFKQLLPAGGEVLYLSGPSSTSSARRRYEGLVRELGDSRIRVRTVSSDWSSEGGQSVIQAWLEQLPREALAALVVGAQNDSMAAGARRALAEEARRRRRNDVMQLPVTGCDGANTFGRRLVAEGMLTATVLVPPVAGRAIDELAEFLRGGPVPPAEIVLGVLPFPELSDCMCDAVTVERERLSRRLRVSFVSNHSRRNKQALMADDVALLEQLQHGEPDAQAALFESCAPTVRRILTRILRQDHDVADAMQDTFVRSFRNATQVKEPLALKGWVARVAESVALDHLRRRQRLRKHDDDSADTVDLPINDADAELRESVRNAYQVLERLPQEERQVFALRYVEGVELAKLAEVCGVSLATIKRRLARAESRFRILAGREPALQDWLSSHP